MSSGGYPNGAKLGIDVGLARVGLAVCDASGILATPVRTLRRDAKKNMDIRALVAEAVQRDIAQIVVGLPRGMSGRETASTTMARDYARLLVDALQDSGRDVPVILFDERLTTVTAHRVLSDAGKKTKDHRKVVDQVAAVAILQHAIDMQRSLMRDVGETVAVCPAGRPSDASCPEDRRTSTEEPTISKPNADGEQGQ